MNLIALGRIACVSLIFVTASLLLQTIHASGQKFANQKTPQRSAQVNRARPTGSLKVITGQQSSVVFINNVRHGVTNDKGELDLSRVMSGSYPVRVRTVGYADWQGSTIIVAGSGRSLKVTQLPTSDEPTLHYQKADELRDKGKLKDSVEEYKQALSLRPAFPEARIGAARSL